MKYILILCDAFPPAFAPRMGYLCKFLMKYHWKPFVVTEYLTQNFYHDLANVQDVEYINYYHSKNKIWQQIKYVFVFLADLIFNYKDIIILRKAKKIVKTNNIDIILVSSYRIFPALAAHKLSKKYNIPLIVDLRDIFEQFPNNEYISKKIAHTKLNSFLSKIITKKLLRQRNEILNNADSVITISDWHAKTLSEYNQNINLIYNGFASELFYPQIIKNEKFIITYTGRIESQEIKDPSSFFDAVAKLSIEKKIAVKNFRIQFYLIDEKSKELVKKLAQKHNVTNFIDIFDTVQNKEIPKILNSSSILLLLTNKSTDGKTLKGIMGTKVFEYMAVEKPILCVKNDEDCLEKIVKSANAGLAASTTEDVEKFVLEKFIEWQENGYTRQPVDKDFVQQFSRERQVEQFVNLFNLNIKINKWVVS